MKRPPKTVNPNPVDSAMLPASDVAAATAQSLDCSNSDHQIQIRTTHLKDPAVWEQMILNFFGSIPDPVVKTMDELEALYQGLDCSTKKLRFTADENDQVNNTIDIDIEDIPILEFVSNYSIALFKGIRQVDQPTEVHFYKAIGDHGPTVVFKTINGNGTVQFFNLSNEYP